MATYFKILALLLLTCTASAQTDKQLHFASGVGITFAQTQLIHSLNVDIKKSCVIGFLTGSIAGLAKECYDVCNKGKFDYKDLGCTVLGSVITSTMMYLIHKKK